MVAPAVHRVFGSDVASPACVQPFAFDEKKESRVFKPHGQSRSDAKIRPWFPRGIPVIGEGAHAHDPGCRRSLHEHYSARLSFTRRSVDFAFDRGLAELHSAPVARVRQTNRGAHDAGPVARFNQTRRARPAPDPERVRQSRLYRQGARHGAGHDQEPGGTKSRVKPPETDPAFEVSLRPPMFSEFTGQVKVCERLELLVEAAKKRGDVLEHILLSGPPGLGKTTLANIIANAMGVNVKNTSGPVIEKAGELAGLLTSLERGDVLFIAEIHRLQPTIEEYLYPAMEDYRLDIIIDQGPQARSLRLQLPKFTLVGATTRAGMVSAPLRSRFGMTARLDYYAAEEMQRIIIRSARLLGVEIDPAGAAEIAARARGTPRTANNLLRWVRDYVQVKAEGKITAQLADRALAMLEIDRDGFDQWDKRIIEALIHKFNGGPVGLNSLAVAIGEEAGTIEEVNEPYLIMEGYIKSKPQRRVATANAYHKLGLKPPASAQAELL